MTSTLGLPPQRPPVPRPAQKPLQQPSVANRPNNELAGNQIKFGARGRRLTTGEIQKKEIESEIQDQIRARTNGTFRNQARISQYATQIFNLLNANQNLPSPRAQFLEQALTESTQRLTELARKPQVKMSQETRNFFQNLEPDSLTADLNQPLPNNQDINLIRTGLENKLRASLGRRYQNSLPNGLIHDEVLKINQKYQKVPATHREKLISQTVDILTGHQENQNDESAQRIKAQRTERKQQRKNIKETKRQQLEQEKLKEKKFNESLLGRAYNWFYDIRTQPINLDRSKFPNLSEEAVEELRLSSGTPLPTENTKSFFQAAQEKASNFKTGAQKTTKESKKKIQGLISWLKGSSTTQSASSTLADIPHNSTDDNNTSTSVENNGSPKLEIEGPENNASSKVSTTSEVQAPQKTDENKEKPETQPEAKDRQQPERNDIWKDYPNAKLGAGAAMLAGGIALKLTLIGIVPGLALSAAGLGMMAWGGVIHYQRSKEKDNTKTESPAS